GAGGGGGDGGGGGGGGGGRSRSAAGGAGGVSVRSRVAGRGSAVAAAPVRDELGLAIDRASGARPIAGNRLEHHPDSPRALEVMLGLIAQARRWVHFENYIIRDDRTGRRFAAARTEPSRGGGPGR